MLIAVLCASVVCQVVAAIAALRLIKTTGRSLAWVLISTGLLLMAVRRLVPLYALWMTPAAAHVDPVNELIGLALSVAMCAGVLRIGPLFREGRAVEERLARIAQEWQATFDASNDAIWVLDDKQRVVRANRQADQLWQRGGGVIGHCCWETAHGTTAPIPECPVVRSRASGHRESLVTTMGDRWYQITSDPIRDPAGRYTGAAHVVRDITEHKRVEDMATLSAQRMEALLRLNQMTDATLQQITDFALEEAVRLTRSTIGYLAFVSEDESTLTMHSWSKAAMAECAIIDKPIVYPVATTGLWGEAIRQRRAIITNDYAAPNPLKKGCPPGHVAVRRHMNAPIFDGARVVIVAGVGNKEADYDESDVRQLTLLMEGAWRLLARMRVAEALRASEESLRRLNQSLEERVRGRTAELEAANKENEAFSYSVSHDLRAPLRTIDGFSLALLEDCADQVDAVGKDYLRRIRSATQHMGALIDDMLRLSRITRAEMTLDAVDLSQLGREVVDELRRQQPERSVQVEIAAGLAVRADRKLMRILLENLLGNAWKFTGKRAEAVIEMGAASAHGRKSYFIRDNGAGFDMAYVGKLFMPFQRLHSVEEFPGTGIGLGTVQRIMQRHGGTAWAVGQVGQGATFHFSFEEPKGEHHEQDPVGGRQPG